MSKVKLSPEAKNDLVEIKGYISQELNSPQAAENLISKIIKRVRWLSEYPEMGPSLSSLIDIQTDYRFLVCAGYLIFYRYENEMVFVVRILYGRRNYLQVLCGDLPEE